MIFIDTNIVMYAVGREHRYKEPCARIIMEIARGKIGAVTDAEVLQEILYRYWHIGELEKGLQVFRDFEALMPQIYEITRSALVTAAAILQQHSHISPRDALHVAVMKSWGIETIYSTDADFDAIEGIERVDPLKLEKMP
jgi:predicted nucleic acid-binding protein